MNYFINYEGIDGSGKDTQLLIAAEKIKDDDGEIFGNKYSNIWITREPTRITKSGNEICDLMRGNVSDGERFAKLFIGDRIEHSRIIENIIPHSHILTSRYDISTFSYQMAQGLDFKTMYSEHKFGEKGGAIIPDLTLVFDLPVDEAFKRMGKRDSAKEIFEVRNFQEKVRENIFYVVDELKKLDGRRIEIINANQPIVDVSKEMVDSFKKHF